MKTDYQYRAISNQVVAAFLAVFMTGLLASSFGPATNTPATVEPALSEAQAIVKPATAPAVVRLPTIVVTAKRI
ncbi:MAG: hypothetical protein JNM52_05205 [Betaproteobacteria bacterium]|nr:hypothetical protein [Betaproteobacteria bacterium]